MKNYICSEHHVHNDVTIDVTNKLPVDDKIIQLSDIFKILSDSSRLKIIFALMEKELCVCDICGIVCMSQSAVSHQLRLLRSAHLVKYRRSGKMVFYSIDDSHVESIIAQAFEHIMHQHSTN